MVLVKDIYPAYLTWEQWEENQAKMADNHQRMQSQFARKNRNQSGAALLTGLVRCGKCGHAMRVLYKDNRFQYACAKSQNESMQGTCQYLSGKRIDEAVVTSFFEAICPAQIDAFKAASAEYASLHQEQLTHLRQDVQRLTYAATRAERQYNNVDPENRLIAATLESKWEQALAELSQARLRLADLEKGQPPLPKISAQDRKRFRDAGKRMPDLWEDFSFETRKALMRTLITGVNLDRGDDGLVNIRIVWSGGLVTELEQQVPIHSRQYSRLESQVVDRLRELNDQGLKNEDIITQLNDEGFLPCRGGQFTMSIVMKLKERHSIKSRCQQIREGQRPDNKYTADEIAAEVGVKRAWIYRKISRGEIRIKKDSTFGCYLFPRTKRAVKELIRLKEGKRAHVCFQ